MTWPCLRRLPAKGQRTSDCQGAARNCLRESPRSIMTAFFAHESSTTPRQTGVSRWCLGLTWPCACGSRRRQALVTSTPSFRLPTLSASQGISPMWAVAETGPTTCATSDSPSRSAGMRVDDRLAALPPLACRRSCQNHHASRGGFCSRVSSQWRPLLRKMAVDLAPVFESFRPDVVIHGDC